MRRRVSIKDIARAANTAHSTVSRALRGSALISAGTRERIQRLAHEMGYTPDAVAQSLQTRRTNTVGLVVTSIADPFFADVVKGVEEAARPAGFSVFLSSSHNDPEQEIEVIETFHRRRVDGLLVASARMGSAHVERLARIDVPVVLVNSEAEGGHGFLHAVAVDDRAGAREAVGHLLALGHRRIGYVGAGNRPQSNRRRLEGYREALAAAGIVPPAAWAVVAAPAADGPEGDVEAARAAAERLLAAGVTALFCFNDLMATGVLLACRARGCAVPAGCSVVGFDDVALARYVAPPLTTVRQPMRALGNEAMRLLQALLEGRPAEDRVLAPVLVCRESTAAPPASLLHP